MDRPQHWNSVYTTKAEGDVSWFEPLPEISLRLIAAAGATAETCVVDISGAALQRAKERIGAAAAALTWIEADVTGAWSLKPMDIWHDRAVFHFLTDPADRRKYVGHLHHTLKAGGTAIIATFGPDGPEKCSGLPVCRYSPADLKNELGDGLAFVESVSHHHRTPWGSTQSFQYSRFVATAS
jgi:SAM-dependent methyltransferase